ncbi:MAG: ASCH domain-containing protein [Bacteroidales bacterium]|nr:ASCH domain-containing protein [Bacteroidales bacterium]
MKTLSVKQPWASLITEGIKDIENRTWQTKYRGRVLIHASGTKKQFKIELNDECAKECFGFLIEKSANEGFKFGAIIGSVEIVDCVINHESIWAEKTAFCDVGNKRFFKDPIIYNWVLANPILFEKPIENVKGKLGLWNFEMPTLHYGAVSVDEMQQATNIFFKALGGHSKTHK